MKIYLDDLRTPCDNGWTIVRTYDDFVDVVMSVDLSKIEYISLDHDLGLFDKTGHDVVKWFVEYFYDINPDRVDMTIKDKQGNKAHVPMVTSHSSIVVGYNNIIGVVNSFYKNEGLNIISKHVVFDYYV